MALKGFPILAFGAGGKLLQTIQLISFAKATAHGLGDGTHWIARQVKQNFGQQGSYLVDFFHVCDYLSVQQPNP